MNLRLKVRLKFANVGARDLMEASGDRKPADKASSFTEMRGEFYRNSIPVTFSLNVEVLGFSGVYY